MTVTNTFNNSYYMIGDLTEDHKSEIVNLTEKLRIDSKDDSFNISILLDTYGGDFFTGQTLSNIILDSKAHIKIECSKAYSLGVQLLLSSEDRDGYDTSTILIHAIAASNSDLMQGRATPGYLKEIDEDLLWMNEKYIRFITDRTSYEFDYLYNRIVIEDRPIILHGEKALELGFIKKLIRFGAPN